MNASLAQLARQLAAIWNQLGLNQRISVVVAGLVVAGGLAGLVIWSNRGDYALLYGRLEDAEAAKVIAALDDAKVPYRAGQGTIFVPSAKVHQVRMQLAAKGLPKSEGGVGFEIFDKPNFGISDFVQRANYLRALQGELSRTISQLDEVEAARVMIVMPENRLLTDTHRRPTASVFIKARGSTQLPGTSVSAIQFLVANSVEGLQASRVSVVDSRGNVLSQESEGDSVAGLSSTQLAARKNLETYLAKKAEGMLEKVLGPGQAVVRVSAEINFDSLTRVEEKIDPESQVIRTATLNDETSDSSIAGASGGVPGVSINANTESNATALASAPANKSVTKKKTSNNQYDFSRTTSNMTQLAGGLKRLSAAVFVAARTSGGGTNRVVEPRSAEELQKLRRIVQSALGIMESDPQRRDEIVLEEMPFTDHVEQEFAQVVQQQQRRQFWFDMLPKVAYPALALAALAVFFRILRRTGDEFIPVGVPLGHANGNGNGNGNGHGNGHSYRPGNGHGTTPLTRPGSHRDEVLTVDALNQLIRENPENMSQAIRAWMLRGRPND